MNQLQGKKVAILATDGFEHSELFKPKEALEQEGAEVQIVSLKSGEIKSWQDKNWGESIKVDKTLEETSADQFNALVLPGGVINPDTLRSNKEAVKFVQGFFHDKKQKPVAAICHGPWMLAEAGVIKNRKMTSYGSIKTDIMNAGADWVDQEVVVDQGLVTSRQPKDLDAFISKTIEEIGEGQHKKHKSAS